MLENLYTTKMSNDKEKLKTRLENIQKEPKKKHKVVGLLVFLALAAALTVGTFCLAATDREAAPDVTMTDEEFAAFLEEPWGAVMASLDYANEEILIFHYNQALCVLDLTNHASFRYIFDLRDLNITTQAQGDVFLQVDVAQDGSMAYLSTGGMTDLAAAYDTYVIDLTTGQVEKGKSPRGADLFQDKKDTFAVIPDVTGWSSQCITVGDRTYYLNSGGPMVNQLQLVTHFADSRTDSIWYLFGEPDIISDAAIEDLYAMTVNYMDSEFHQVYDPHYDIQELTLSNWQQNGNEATFFYTMTYLHYNRDPSKVAYIQSVKDDPELYKSLCKDYLALQTSNYAFKIIWEGDCPVLYYEVDVEGGVDYHGPITIDDFVMGPQSEDTVPSEPSQAEDTASSDPPLQQTGHFNTLAFKTGNYLNGEFSRAHSSDLEILEQSLGNWEYSSENEGTFLYTVTYTAQDAEDQQEPLQMTIPMKVTRDEDGQLTLYRDTSEFGGQESTGPEWTPADVESMMTLP